MTAFTQAELPKVLTSAPMDGGTISLREDWPYGQIRGIEPVICCELEAVMADPIERYRAEADDICRTALRAAEAHYVAETPWFYTVYTLGIPSAILSAIAGGAAFRNKGNSADYAGALSIVVTILTTLVTVLNPTKTAARYHTTAKEYEALYHEARYFSRIELCESDINPKKSAETLKRLAAKLSDINKTSPEISHRALRVAERRIKENRGEAVRVYSDDAANRTDDVHKS